MKCLIIGDSLAANRPDGIQEYERWPSLLLERCSIIDSIDNKAKSYSTSKIFSIFSKEYLNDFDLIIVQIGIVDCTPRIFRKTETRIIARIPKLIRQPLIRFFKKRRKRSIHRRYIDPYQFGANFKDLISNFQKPIIAIEILGSESYLLSNELVKESVSQYNTILMKLSQEYVNFQLLKLDTSKLDDLTLADGYHLNLNGHQYISNQLKSLLERN